ncbi:MAG: TetR/AcrR family transcriptional regulator [Chloroflexi bacterium]|nr:MAG: TetR/AcrR family transcriptional regulator [Chloroflexota bacterium]
MIHIMKERKTYRSQLRQEHTERTRDLIMEGLIRTMANGAVTWSIPDVAREAGVSVPTVYRYFRTKQDLVQGLGDYVVRKAGLAAMKPPQSPQELVSLVRQMYISSEGLSDAFRMASVSELASEVRKESIPLRLRMTEEALAPVLSLFDEQDRVRLVRMVLLLTSSAMIRAFKEYLDLSGTEAAETVGWAILTLAYAGSSNEKTKQQRLEAEQ